MTATENQRTYVCADCRSAIDVAGECPWCAMDVQRKPFTARPLAKVPAGLLAKLRDAPQLTTCENCLALHPPRTRCPACNYGVLNAQAAPGQPIPKDMEPPDPEDPDGTTETQ